MAALDSMDGQVIGPMVERPDAGSTGPGHRVAAPQAWPWLPRISDGTLARHAYCADCGQVRALGSERPLRLGGLWNLLGRFYRVLEREGRRVSEAQRRLVVRRLEAAHVDDAFALTRRAQLGLVAALVGPLVGLSASVVESYLRSC